MRASPTYWPLVLALSGGCSIGGGPVIGYGQRGFVLGAEAGGGPLFLHATGGYQSGGLYYGRLDITPYELQQSFDASIHPLGRIGLGAGFTTSTQADGEDLHWHLIAAAGAGVIRSTTDASSRCSQYGQQDATAISATIELRYAGQFEVVLAPQYSWSTALCGK